MVREVCIDNETAGFDLNPEHYDRPDHVCMHEDGSLSIGYGPRWASPELIAPRSPEELARLDGLSSRKRWRRRSVLRRRNGKVPLYMVRGTVYREDVLVESFMSDPADLRAVRFEAPLVRKGEPIPHIVDLGGGLLRAYVPKEHR